MIGRKNYKSKWGEIFVHSKAVELLLVRSREVMALSLAVTGQVCPVLISLGLKWHWQLAQCAPLQKS